jgi:single-strand DNA-binding protein
VYRKGLARMSQDNHITLRGYLTAEPTLHQKTATATPVTEIRVGSTPRRLNRETGEWYDAPTSYYRVKCWRRLAINAASSLHKGDMVVVHGRFYMSTWVDSQQRPRSTLEIEADSLGHDLTYGWSHFLRGTRSQPEGAAGGTSGWPIRTRSRPARVSAATSTPATGTLASRVPARPHSLPAARPMRPVSPGTHWRATRRHTPRQPFRSRRVRVVTASRRATP